MTTRIAKLLFYLILVVLSTYRSGGSEQQDKTRQGKYVGIDFQEKVVAGGHKEFMEVRHLKLRGSNFEIGKKLAEIAFSRHKSGPIPYPCSLKTKAQRQYFALNYPAYLERMRGVATTFGKELKDNSLNFSGLYYNLPLRGPGCSVVFYPPSTTDIGEGVLSRNFDLTTGAIDGTRPKDGEFSVCSRPYVIEMYPDEGYASLVICCFDLLGGVCDGINSEGLTVAILSDNDVIEQFGIKPASGPEEGFNEIQIVRYLLDTCSDVEQAKKALRKAVLYYNLAPNHYILADRYGNSFIWENSPENQEGYTYETDDDVPLITTNFQLHRYSDLTKLPADKHPLGWFNRYREIQKRVKEHTGKFDDEFIKRTNECVSFTDFPPPDPYMPIRTLWHALYYPEQRRLEVAFYLGEEIDKMDSNRVKIRRSDYVEFSLEY